MKKYVLAAGILMSLFACKNNSEPDFSRPANESEIVTETPEALGKSVFEGKGNCVSCHQLEQKGIGPSVKEIAQTYQAEKGNLVAFLKEEADAIVDPSQYAVMQANLALTKTFTDAELQGLEQYFLAQTK
jgi:cytochrome c